MLKSAVATFAMLGGADGLRDVRTPPAAAFDYKHLDLWRGDCKGSAQSPIDIFSSQIAPVPDIGSTIYGKFESTPVAGRRLTSEAHSVRVDGNFGTLSLPDGKYEATQLHIHMPSEHAMNGILAAGEMHIVFYRNSTNPAVPDSMAVVAILLQDEQHVAADIDQQTAAEHIQFFKQLGLGQPLASEGEAQPIEGAVDLSVFKKTMQGNFFHYKGSLTEPPCTETVHWYVLEKPAVVRQFHIQNIMKNFTDQGSNRPVQPINERKVVANSISYAEEKWGESARVSALQLEAGQTSTDSAVPASVAASVADVIPEDESSPTHWDYADKARWGKLSPDCKGAAQSPIDIISTKVLPSNQGVSLKNYLQYKSAKASSLFNNGHALQVDGDFGSITLPDGTYNVRQFHFHFPAEHAINHNLAAGELHIVHQRENAEGTDALAVVAILLQDEAHLAADAIDTPHANILKQFWAHLGAGEDLPNEGERRQIAQDLNLAKVFDHSLSHEFYHYMGSLTTPPCAETVHWYVLEKPALVTEKMIASYKNAFKNPQQAQNRPVQALNGRPIVNTDLSLPNEFGQKA